MIIFYYMLTNIHTKEEAVFPTNNFLGDIGEEVYFNGGKWVIDDYAEEYHNLEGED